MKKFECKIKILNTNNRLCEKFAVVQPENYTFVSGTLYFLTLNTTDKVCMHWASCLCIWPVHAPNSKSIEPNWCERSPNAE